MATCSPRVHSSRVWRQVKAVRMSRERVVVVLEYKIYVRRAGSNMALTPGSCSLHACHLCRCPHAKRQTPLRRRRGRRPPAAQVYNFADLNLLHTIETASNPRGLCSLCPDSRACVLACPGLQKGHVKVELFDITRTTIVPAHESSLGYLATNLDGTRLATASERGTLVRVWDTKSGQRLHELRRGAEPADIQCVSFSHDLLWLLVSSDHGTVHLFRLGDEAEAAAAAAAAAPPPISTAADRAGGAESAAAENTKSNFAFLGNMLPKAITPSYFQSHWSFAQFRLPGSEKTLTKNICAFGPPGSHTFLVVSADGTFFKCSFDPVKGGECTREDWQRFLLPDDDE